MTDCAYRSRLPYRQSVAHCESKRIHTDRDREDRETLRDTEIERARETERLKQIERLRGQENPDPELDLEPEPDLKPEPETKARKVIIRSFTQEIEKEHARGDRDRE